MRPDLIAQGDPEKLVCVALFDFADGHLARIDLCHVAPTVDDVERTGEYPS